MSNLNFVRFSIVQLADYQTDLYRNLYINRFSHSVTAKLIDSSREYLQQKIYMIALLSLNNIEKKKKEKNESSLSYH